MASTVKTATDTSLAVAGKFQPKREIKKMSSIKQLSCGRKDLFLIEPELIKEKPGWNVRVNSDSLQGHVRQLADSIKEIGVQQPLTVYMEGEDVFLTDGHCRMEAVRLAMSEGADIKAVPVRVEERYSNDADRALSLLTRNSGRPLAIPEQAEVVKRLLSFGWVEADVARKTGYSRQHVSNLITYMSSSQEVKEMVENGLVSPSTVIEAVRVHGDEGATGAIREAAKKANSEGRKKVAGSAIKKRDIVKPLELFAGKLPAEDAERKEKILGLCEQLRELVETGA